MRALLDQLDLDQSFFVELAILATLFFILANLFFKPFLRLVQLRYERTTADRESAEKMVALANAKLEEYHRLVHEGRTSAKKEYELALAEAKKQEAEILAHAREEAKKITQEAADSVHRQRDELKQSLEHEIEAIAQGISDRLLSRKI